MSATQTSKAPEAQVFGLQSIDLGRIETRKDNPRKHFNEETLKELAANIAQVGILQPLIVRPLLSRMAKNKVEDKIAHGLGMAVESERRFEIVAGERRYRAAGLAKLPAVPCLVRELTDAQVIEIQGVENLQREDISPIEEAEWMQRMMLQCNYTADALAAKIGKSRSHVFSRLRLAKLSPKVRDAIGKHNIEPVVAMMIATIPDPKEQSRAAEQLSHLSARQAKEEIERCWRRDLKKAQFGLSHPQLVPGCPSCELCPKRSGNLDPETSSPNVCTDTGCFDKKQEAWAMSLLETKRKEGCTIIDAKAWSDWSVRNRYQELDEPAYEYVRDGSEKTYKGLLKSQIASGAFKPTYTVDRDGQLVAVAPRDKLPDLMKAAGVKRQPGYGSSNGNATYRAEQKKNREKRVVMQAALARALVTIGQEAAAAPPDVKFWKMLVNVLAHNVGGGQNNEAQQFCKLKSIEKVPMSYSQPDYTKGMWQYLDGFDGDEKSWRALAMELLCVDGWMQFYSVKWGEKFQLIAKWAGVDLAALEKETAKDIAAAKGAKRTAANGKPKSEAKKPTAAKTKPAKVASKAKKGTSVPAKVKK